MNDTDAPPDPITARIGRAIRQTRNARAISQEALAQDCNLSLDALQAIEEGTRRASSGALVRIAKALDVEALHFFRPSPR